MGSQNFVHHFSYLDKDDAQQSAAGDFIAFLLQSQEAERKRLAGEIHDKLGQNLLALKMDVSRLHERTLASHPRINSKAGHLLGHLDIAFQNIREIINLLRPPVLELGLLASMQWKVREFERGSGLPCSLQIDGHEDEYVVFDRHAMPMVRILHESLNNITRHAKASAADVSLSPHPSGMTLSVYDDGIGIQPGDLKKARTYGMACIREHVRLMKGSMSIGRVSDAGGTMLMVAIPSEPLDAN